MARLGIGKGENNLSKYMRLRNIHSKQLGKMTGVCASTINNWTTGDTEPSIMTMRKIADALLCSVTDIWPHIKEPVDWECRHQLITERLEKLDYRKDAEEYSALCEERSWVSCKIYINEQRTRLKSFSPDDYCQGETYGRMPSTGKVITL